MIRRSRSVIVLGWLLVMLVAGYSIFSKEYVLRKGTWVLLELAPVDPRSLMQGDYMQISFAIDEQIAVWLQARGKQGEQGYVHIRLDELQRGEFLRIAAKPAREAGVYSLKLRYQAGRYSVGPNAFFFQEGTAEQLQQARWGGLRIAANGDAMLVSLHDQDLARLSPLMPAF